MGAYFLTGPKRDRALLVAGLLAFSVLLCLSPQTSAAPTHTTPDDQPLKAAPSSESRATMPFDADGQLHLGFQFGSAAATFSEQSISGYAGGMHVTYGVSDAFNLRLHGDVSAFPEISADVDALMVHGALGVEYVFDILRWVPYAGVLAGGTHFTRTGGEPEIYFGIDVPVGLGYRLTRNMILGAEARFRVLLFTDDSAPSDTLLLLGRLEYAWLL